jgi:hypothetical protein
MRTYRPSHHVHTKGDTHCSKKYGYSIAAGPPLADATSNTNLYVADCRTGDRNARKRIGHSLLRSNCSNRRNSIRFIRRTSRTSGRVFRARRRYSLGNPCTRSEVRMPGGASPEMLLLSRRTAGAATSWLLPVQPRHLGQHVSRGIRIQRSLLGLRRQFRRQIEP